MKSSNTIIKPHLPKFKQGLCTAYILYNLFILSACDSKDPPLISNEQVDQDLGDRGIEAVDQALIPDQDLVTDAGLDMSPESDMAWTFDLDVVEEEYSERAANVERIYAGYAEQSLGFPLGIATVGYFPAPGGFRNPFAPSGTHTQHSHLNARALLLRQGQQSLVMLRVDLIAIWQDLVVDVKRELRSRGRGDLADGLIIGATHSHASGGRIVSHPILRLLAGQFSPALYHRILDNLVEVVLEADQNVRPAQVGYDTIQVSSLHSDRRCENGDLIDHSMGLLKVSDDNGELQAILVNYAMHGTVFASDDFLLSSDATGAIEHGVEQRLANYAPVLYFQSWAGDVSPETPNHQITQDGNELKDEYKELEAIGKEAAEIIIPAIEEMETRDDLDLQVKTIRFPMNNDLVNPDGSFDRFPHGGAYCYPTDGENCPEDGEEQRIYTPDDLICLIKVPEADGIRWGQIVAVKLGEIGMVSLPGEPLTSVGLELRDRALDLTGLEQVWVLGYTQGYLGYLLHYDDYFLGGYEAAGGIWGPGLGQFLVDRGVEIIAHLMDTSRPLSFLPVPLPEKADVPNEAVVIEEALGEHSWIEDVSKHEDGYWTAEFVGGDPAIDSPYVLLEKAITDENGNETWSTFTHFSGKAWSSHGPEIELSLRVDPTYGDRTEQIGRHFYWRIRMSDQFSVLPSIGELTGKFRWRVSGQDPDEYELESGSFTIGE